MANFIPPKEIISKFNVNFTFEEFYKFCKENIFIGDSPKTVKNNTYFRYFCEQLNIAQKWRTIDEFMWCVIHKDSEEHKYCTCGKEVLFSLPRGRHKTCGDINCKERFAHTDEVYDKKKNTCLEKYGVDHYSKTKEYKEKYQATSIERYGETSFMRNEEMKKKYAQSLKEKTGYSSSLSNPKTKEKIKNTKKIKLEENPDYLKNIGIKAVETYKQKDPDFTERTQKSKNTINKKLEENPNYWKDISDRAFATKYENAGGKENYDKFVYDKIQASIINKYGTLEKYFTQREIKTKQTYLEELGVTCYRNTQEFREEYFSKRAEQLSEFQKNNPNVYSFADILLLFSGIFDHYHIIPYRQSKILESSLYEVNIPLYTYNYGNGDNSKKFSGCYIEDINNFKNNLIPIVERKCIAFIKDAFRSEGEKELFDYIKSLVKDDVISNERKILGVDGKKIELDIFIPSKRIAFEYNGTYWHSIDNVKDRRYHLNKTLECEKCGIRLIHIWDFEWLFENEKIKSFIRNVLQEKTRIFARKCEVKKVDLMEEKAFLKDNHLQGYRKSLVCYGLYYNNELLQIMSFCKSRYRKSVDYELLRLCTKRNYTIVGGTDRLFFHFVKEYNPQTIISYCNREKFTGNVYNQLGFESEQLRPDEFFVKLEKNNYKKFSTNSLNAIGADKLLKTDLGKGADNKTIALDNGYLDVYSVGQEVFLWKKPYKKNLYNI